MRYQLSPLFILSLLILILLPCSEAKKKNRPKLEAGPTSQTALSSGELSTKDGHRCTWAAHEGGNSNLLQVRCSSPAGEGLGETYECQFSGKPQECPAYIAQSAQYWKQVVGKLKKRSNACEGEKVLKTRLCKKGPAAAHMKLTESRPGEAGSRGKKTAGKQGARDKRKQAKEEERDDEPIQGDGLVEDVEVEYVEAEESYCGEGWHSLCKFFVKLLDG